MLTGSTKLIAAVASASAMPVQTVTVDRARSGSPIDISGLVTSISIERSLTTDVPDGTRLVVGYAAATATIDLGGEPLDNEQDAGWMFSPANVDSPWYGTKRIGAPVVVKMGYETTTGSETLPRFTGTVRSLTVDGQARTAEIQAVDGSDRLRTQVLLPMATNLGNPSLDGRFYIDYILTANGITPGDQDLEDSLNPLIATPYTGDKVDAWSTIQAIAAAEYATAFFDGSGLFHYWNRQHFSGQVVNYSAKTVTVGSHTYPIPQVTSDHALATLQYNEAVDSVINDVVISYTPYVIQPPDWVWQTGATRGLHSGETITIWADFDDPVQSVGTTVQVIPVGGDTGSNSGYRACSTPDGTGEPIENLTFTVTAFAQSAKIVVHNPNKHPVYLVCPRYDSAGHLYPDASVGQPTLWIRGRPVTTTPTAGSTTDGNTDASVTATDAGSITDFGDQQYSVDGGGWIQDVTTAATLANDLVALLARPGAYLGDVEVVGDPRLEIGDRVELIDDTGTGLDQHCWIVGITDSETTDGGYTQTLTLRLAAGIGQMIWDHPVYGFWDTYNWDSGY